jgi:hypothetical protein
MASLSGNIIAAEPVRFMERVGTTCFFVVGETVHTDVS